jgi:DNA (cytosine-5)-methyltransferase 1
MWPRDNVHVTVDSPSFTFVDLFAGIGGTRLAFEAAGGICVFSSEFDSFACDTYERNFGERPSGDITKIDPAEVPRHDVLVAGFPCQPFSIAGVSKNNSLGNGHGFQHPTQGTLFFHIRNLIEECHPRAFLLENVKNLINHDRGRTFKIIRWALEEELNYDFHWDVIDAQLALPQHRERTYIVGFRKKVDFKFPTFDQSRPRTLARVLQRNVPERYVLTENLWNYLQEYSDKHRAKGNGFGFGLVEDVKRGVTRTLSARYYKDGSEILIPTDQGRPRRLTPRECARLMGFPPGFKIPVSDTQAYKQFGNSVAVPVVTSIAKKIAEVLASRSSPDSYVGGRYRTTVLHSARNGIDHAIEETQLSAAAAAMAGD